MDQLPRHQCLIYQGPPSRHLPALAAIMRDKLQQNYRCLYLNSPPMVAGMRSYLAATGVDVAHEITKTSLILTSERDHLVEGRFVVDHMMRALETGLRQALADGYAGLWATGDMTWEMGPNQDFSRLLEYEWRLEKFFHVHPALSGVCQYHSDTLPPEVVRHGLVAHPSIFINQTMSLFNQNYILPESFTPAALEYATLDSTIERICRMGGAL